jgi:cytoskeletal protein CcmA (bactofilin family)
MKRWIALVILTLLVTGSAAIARQQLSADEQRTLRTRIEQRFDVVPLTDGVALRPKTRLRDVRLIEVTDGSILINGVAVTGQELRERLGSDASDVLRLSYLDAESRRALFATAPATPAEPATPPVEPQPPLERTQPTPSEPERPRTRRPHTASGDRVRIFGNIVIPEDESIDGQAVAIMGSVRVDGEVGNQVVAVLGSVDLGPKAVVHGDVISVGGRVHRREGSQIRGAVTEVALSEPNIHLDFVPLFDWQHFWFFNGWGAIPRLIGTTFRFLLLLLLASIAMVVARPTVEATAHRVVDNPVKATAVGLLAQILFWPVLLITAVVLAISIIGIPLLLLLPFAVLLLILLALLGFAGVAYAIGQGARRRFGMGAAPPFADLFLGILVLMSPILVARLIALAGWPVTPIAILLILTGLAIEFLAWSAGFGAVLTNAFSRWQARRAMRQVTPAPPPA